MELEDFHFPVTSLHANETINFSWEVTEGSQLLIEQHLWSLKGQRQRVLSWMDFPGSRAGAFWRISHKAMSSLRSD